MAWLATLPPDQAQPGAGNTLWHAEWAAAGGAGGLGARPQMGLLQEEKRVAAVPAAAVPSGAAAIEAGKAGALGDAPVLFLGAVPEITNEAGLPPADELRRWGGCAGGAAAQLGCCRTGPTVRTHPHGAASMLPAWQAAQQALLPLGMQKPFTAPPCPGPLPWPPCCRAGSATCLQRGARWTMRPPPGRGGTTGRPASTAQLRQPRRQRRRGGRSDSAAGAPPAAAASTLCKASWAVSS